MIHTSIEPDSLAGVDVLALPLLLSLLPPHAATATLTAASTASNTFGVLTLPPRRSPPYGRRCIWREAVPDTTTFGLLPRSSGSPALAGAPSRADNGHRDRSNGRT